MEQDLHGILFTKKSPKVINGDKFINKNGQFGRRLASDIIFRTKFEFKWMYNGLNSKLNYPCG